VLEVLLELLVVELLGEEVVDELLELLLVLFPEILAHSPHVFGQWKNMQRK